MKTVVSWKEVGTSEQGGWGWGGKMYRTVSCLFYKPRHNLRVQLLLRIQRRARALGWLMSSLALLAAHWPRPESSRECAFCWLQTECCRCLKTLVSIRQCDTFRPLPERTPFHYHELSGCYVPSLWTLRTVCASRSRIHQQFTGKGVLSARNNRVG